jgi:hypothetical protein
MEPKGIGIMPQPLEKRDHENTAIGSNSALLAGSTANGSSVALKPCPFCGSKAQMEKIGSSEGHCVYVACQAETDCYVRPTTDGRWLQDDGSEAETIKIVAECWNKREPG